MHHKNNEIRCQYLRQDEMVTVSQRSADSKSLSGYDFQILYAPIGAAALTVHQEKGKEDSSETPQPSNVVKISERKVFHLPI